MRVVISSDVIRRIESLNALLQSKAQRGGVYAFVKALLEDGERYGVTMSVAGADSTQWGESWLECLDRMLDEVNRQPPGDGASLSWDAAGFLRADYWKAK